MGDRRTVCAVVRNHESCGVFLRKQLFLRTLVFLVTLGALVAVSLGQSAGTGAIAGTVTDPSGAVVAGAAIKAIDVRTGETRTAVSSSNGTYLVPLLHAGDLPCRGEQKRFQAVGERGRSRAHHGDGYSRPPTRGRRRSRDGHGNREFRTAKDRREHAGQRSRSKGGRQSPASDPELHPDSWTLARGFRRDVQCRRDWPRRGGRCCGDGREQL